MSVWEHHHLKERVRAALESVPVKESSHNFGRLYISSYQLAIGLERRYPGIASQIGKPLGGKGVGRYDSLAQYLAGELMRQIKSQGVECLFDRVFMSNLYAHEISFTGPEGVEVASSLVGSGLDMSLFRMRDE